MPILDTLLNINFIEQPTYYIFTNLVAAIIEDNQVSLDEILSKIEDDVIDLPILPHNDFMEIKLLANWEFEFTTALMVAARLGKQDFIDKLLKNGADVNLQQSFSGKTALHLIIESDLRLTSA